MKTKLLLTTVFLLSFFQSSFSQEEYYPFLNNSTWILIESFSCCTAPESKIVHEGEDVVIGDYTYKKFIDPFPSVDTSTWQMVDTIYVREDVAERKVYELHNGVESILYDFTLEPGDYFSQYGFTWNINIDYISVNGGTRKRITLNTIELYNNHSLVQKWIEGVGSNAHPFNPQRNMTSVMSAGGGYNIYTRCSFQDGEYIYGSGECGTLMQTLATPEESYQEEISFSPNPFTTELTIETATALQNGTFKLYNMQGQVVMSIDQLTGNRIIIARNNLANGLYFGQLSENGKPIRSTKLIVD